MKILIAPDSFKGSMSAYEFCQTAEKALLSLEPEAEITLLPMADGGEGTVDTLLSLPGSEKISTKVFGPNGKTVEAYYNLIEDQGIAIIEMASASGLPLIPENQRDAMLASTIGTGQLIQDALKRGAQKLILGLGGSATTDAGIGMLSVLGFQFLDKNGQSVALNGAGLNEIVQIVPPVNDFSDIDIKVACDIHNPLYGETGAAYVFGPQKGASEEQVKLLDAGLRNFARVACEDLDIHVSGVPGAGAAGGMGAGLQLIGGELESGFKIIADFLGLDELIAKQQFDLVITGEGQFNHQSQYGKVPVEVATRAKQHDAYVVAIVGAVDAENAHIYEQGIDAIFALANKPMSLEHCMVSAEQLLFKQIQNIYKLYSS